MAQQDLAKQQGVEAVKKESLPALDHQTAYPSVLTQGTLQRTLADPRTLRPTDVQQLQSAIGNQAVQRLLNTSSNAPTNAPSGPPIVQRSLKVGPAKDRFEEEADEVAQQVVQRKELIQRAPKNGSGGDIGAGFETSRTFEQQLSRTKGHGKPLPKASKASFERSFGAPFDSTFDNVRIHTGADSNHLARSIQAKAFTHGSDIHFGAGEYNPASSQGKHLLAHELTHVVQQKGATLQRKPRGAVIQRTLAMDGTWSWMKLGWATGAKEVWDVIKPKFDLLPRLSTFLVGAKSEEIYRSEDIVALENSVSELTRDYDRAISLDEGKTLQTKLSTLPLAPSAEEIPEVAGTYLTQKKQAAEKTQKLNTQKSELQLLVNALQDLTKTYGNVPVGRGDSDKRKRIISELNELISTATEVLSKEQRSGYDTDVEGLKGAYKTASETAAKAKKEKEEKAKAEEERLAKLALLKKENQEKLGVNYKTMILYAGDDTQLAAILAAAAGSDYAPLVNCRSVSDPAQLTVLLSLARPSEIAKLLPAIGKDNEDELIPLLKVVNKGESDDLAALIRRTNSDKSVLRKLLKRLKGSARDALTLLKLAGDKNEEELLAMMRSQLTVREAQMLLSTTSGSENAPDIETLVRKGGLDTQTAKSLLETEGLRGSASDAIDLLGHEEVDNDIDKATELLSKKGSATDVMWMLQAKTAPDPLITIAEVGEILDTDKFVRDQGEDAANVLKSTGATVAQFVELLEWRTPKEIWSYIDKTKGAHKFSFVYSKLTADHTQTFWTDQVCAEPAFSGGAASINAIIAAAVSPPVNGRYAGGNGFGNYGGIDSDGQMNMLLPGDNNQNEVAYREYDLREHDGTNRGARRMVVGGGKKFYTGNHYGTFAKFAG